MNLLPPRVTGPLSECNRSVVVCNCIPGATVTLIASRAGTDRKIGHKAVSGTKDTIPLDAGAELVEFDTVNASQELSGDQSANSVDGPSVEKSGSAASFSGKNLGDNRGRGLLAVRLIIRQDLRDNGNSNDRGRNKGTPNNRVL